MYAASGLLSFAMRRVYIPSNVVKSVAEVKAPGDPPRFLSYAEQDKASRPPRVPTSGCWLTPSRFLCQL